MPIYGYRCTQCGHTLEVLQSMSDAPLRECPVCMGPLQKQIYPVGIIYKGSGFYTTDYKSTSGGSSAAGAGKTESKSDADGSATSDSASSTQKSGDTSSGDKAADKAAS